ncbi:MAG: site-specific DNA-methyltransferase [Ruminococcus flavefaciens]|nr:site-specific DNA-methyltransferase [Ruminococcus flavefaciens]
MDKMKMETLNLTSQNIEKIGTLFPNCITETIDGFGGGTPKKAINFELLRQMLSEDVVDGDEAYEFTWVGKKASIVEANKPIRKTLRPCKEESKDWDNTENLYIEGDNLEVLKLLQESYLGKVKMIYIDPPYNTGSDFIYRDNFIISDKDYEEKIGLLDDEDNQLFKNSDSNGRFHSDWCSMIYSRLMLGRNLLADNGVIFISIDDNEQGNLKKICDEVFGINNFVSNLVWQSTAGSNTGTDIVTVTENILVYTKKKSDCTFDGMVAADASYTLTDEYVQTRGKYAFDKLDRRRVAGHYSDALNYPIKMPDGSLRYPGGTSTKSSEGWNYLWSESKVKWGIENGFIEFKQTKGEWNVYNKRYEKVDNEGKPIERTVPYRNLITSDQCNTAQGTSELRTIFEFRPFDFPKPSNLIKKLMLACIRKYKSAVILDFFSGSATTAHATMQLNAEDGGNRKFIMVQLPEPCSETSEAYKAGYKNICEIGKERIRRAGDKIKTENPDTTENLDIGFRVLKLDDSNMKDVYYSADEYNQNILDALESNIKEDRTDLDLLFGCLLEWGIPLSLPYSSEMIDGCTVHNYNDGDLIACFDEAIPDSVVKAVAKKKPLRAVFRDSGFENSPSKINVGEIFKMLSPDTRVKVL